MAKKKPLFYKIGEACKQVDIQPYVLRYWETEFPFLKPEKSRSGQRVYSERELEIVRRIKELLYDEGYTIAGAKKKLEGELTSGDDGKPSLDPEAAQDAAPAADAKVRADLDAARADLETAQSDLDAAKADLDTARTDLETVRGDLDSARRTVETLRSGIEEALGDARDLLSRLDTGPAASEPTSAESA